MKYQFKTFPNKKKIYFTLSRDNMKGGNVIAGIAIRNLLES